VCVALKSRLPETVKKTSLRNQLRMNLRLVSSVTGEELPKIERDGLQKIFTRAFAFTLMRAM
jgi:hypothetical protein